MTYHPTRRLLYAYRLTFRVLASYLWLTILTKIFGSNRLQERRFACHRRNAQRIKTGFLELKGIFIKVGQTLSVMTNFLPEALLDGLEGLQDAVPPHDYEEIQERFRIEFDKTPDELYRSFDPTPIASASIGQVHRASLHDGTPVAVKVQYPNIGHIVAVDLKILRRIFGLLHLFFPTYQMKAVFAEIAQMIRAELDYQIEQQNLETIKSHFVGDEDFIFPDVYPEFSTHKVITLKYIEGIKVSHTDKLSELGIDLKAVATKIIHGYCQQIFVDGFYHADPHPGNILIVPGEEGRFQIALLDFGAVAQIDETMRQGMTHFIEGLIRRDTRQLANALRRMGFVARDNQDEAFDRLVEYFYEKFVGLKIENFSQLQLTDFHNLQDFVELKKLDISLRDLMGYFQIPNNWILLERTLLLALGLTAQLTPELNPVEIIIPYVEESILKDRSFKDIVLESTKDVGLAYLMLPREIEKTLKLLRQGQLKVQDPAQKHLGQAIIGTGERLTYGLLGIVGASLGQWWELQGQTQWAQWHYYGAGACGVLFSISLLKSFFRRRP